MCGHFLQTFLFGKLLGNLSLCSRHCAMEVSLWPWEEAAHLHFTGEAQRWEVACYLKCQGWDWNSHWLPSCVPWERWTVWFSIISWASLAQRVPDKSVVDEHQKHLSPGTPSLNSIMQLLPTAMCVVVPQLGLDGVAVSL